MTVADRGTFEEPEKPEQLVIVSGMLLFVKLTVTI